MIRFLAGFGLAAALVLGGTVSAAAQVGDVREAALLREAAGREAAGDLRAAETLLRRIIEDRPASGPALLALERVLRVQGRVEDVVPLLETAVAEDPQAALLHRLLLRTYSGLDRVDAVERASQQWIAVDPGLEVPYRETARVWADRGRYERARAVLEEGRRAIGPDALALSLGDVLASDGEPRAAVREWGRAIDRDGRGLIEVRRRLRDHPDTRPFVPELVERMADGGASTARLDAALELALDAGLHDRARALAERMLPELTPTAGRALLEEVARRADAAGATELAAWAHGGLPEVEGAFREGPPRRRAAAALRIELMAGEDADAALRALRRFRGDHPDAPELDRLSATVAGALIAADRSEEGERLLADADGPRSAALRARLLLEDGEVADARTEYMHAAAGLRGEDATRVLRLVTLLGRVPAPAAAVVGRALRLRDAGRVEEAVRLLAHQPDDLPPLLDLAARLADDAGLGEDARRIRRRIVTDHPRSAEAPAALLALGRELATDEATRGEARAYLERLIIEYPQSALVPQARRELERL